MTLLQKMRQKRDAVIAKVNEIRGPIDAEDGRVPTDDEWDALRALRAELDGIDERIAELAELDERQRNSTANDPAPTESRVEVPARVISEPRTYTRESSRAGTSFVRDVISRMEGDTDAASRLSRHMQEARIEGEVPERRDVGTGAFAGLVVPQYLTDLVAPVARAGRPFANVCRMVELPASGTTVNISRITTGSAVAAQATENNAVQETNMDDTLLTVTVRTIAGMQDVSRQAIDRGTGVDEVVVQDLAFAYATELDRQLLHGATGSAEHEGLINVSGNIGVTYTDASPTAAELYPKLADLIQQIQATVYLGVTHFVMHPRRWWWLAKEVGTSFPFLTVPSAGQQQGGVIGGTDYQGVNRSILGVPVIVDGNIATNLGAGTNEDVIFGVTASECFLWEQPGDPLMLRTDQALSNQLSVRFVLFGYSAFTAGRRPAANGDITGTGLVTPTF